MKLKQIQFTRVGPRKGELETNSHKFSFVLCPDEGKYHWLKNDVLTTAPLPPTPAFASLLARLLFTSESLPAGKKFCYRLKRSTYKFDFIFSSFGFEVLHCQKCYVMLCSAI